MASAKETKLKREVVTTAGAVMMAVSGRSGEVILNALVTVLIQFLQTMCDNDKKRARATLKAFYEQANTHLDRQSW